MIDDRLLNSGTVTQTNENFNRTLAIVSACALPDASEATDGDTLVVDGGEWVIGSGGGGGGVLLIGLSNEGGTLTLDKTWQEIYDHMSTGGLAMVLQEIIDAEGASVSHQIVLTCDGYPSDSEYYLNFLDATFPQFSATSPSGYPSATLTP